jgi:signal recognition particle subunit SRP54
VILMAGLQGSGKTTATAKLARYLREEHPRPSRLPRATSPPGGGRAAREGRRRRPARRSTSRAPTANQDPVEIAAWALERAKQEGKDVLIVDTSGAAARRRGADGGARADQPRETPTTFCSSSTR